MIKTNSEKIGLVQDQEKFLKGMSGITLLLEGLLFGKEIQARRGKIDGKSGTGNFNCALAAAIDTLFIDWLEGYWKAKKYIVN